MTRLTATGLIDLIIDPGSWTSWDASIDMAAGPVDYTDTIADAQARTGLDESVITGTALMNGHLLTIIASEFEFLGGSIGTAAATRITEAIRRATVHRLPILALPTSGGTRMQEGTIAFLQIVRIASALADYKAGTLPYLVYLRHPTTGGVFASWASLGHITLAEPGALIGFLGPKVYQAIKGSPFPTGIQTAENLYTHGIVDAIVPPSELRRIVADVLDMVTTGQQTATITSFEPRTMEDVTSRSAWSSVIASRDPQRPGVRELLALADKAVSLHGTGSGEVDPSITVALAMFDKITCVLVGQDRHAQTDLGVGPSALRQARRGIQLAADLNLPMVFIIDTLGGELSVTAEERALSGEIARCLADMITVSVPTLSIILGQGTGGAALALLAADRLLAASNSWLSPLPPEGASAILYSTTARAAEVAQSQGIRAVDLLAYGAVDHIIGEYHSAVDEADTFINRVAAAIPRELSALTALDSSVRMSRRQARFDYLADSSPQTTRLDDSM
ncbi:carboxyl transferase domain-containing protein [Nocardia sp. NPDC004750]